MDDDRSVAEKVWPRLDITVSTSSQIGHVLEEPVGGGTDLWIGTSEGLYRISGIGPERISEYNTLSLEAFQGRLWLSDSEGLKVRSPNGTFDRIWPQDESDSPLFYRLEKTGDRLWALSESEILFTDDGEVFQLLDSFTPSCEGESSSILQVERTVLIAKDGCLLVVSLSERRDTIEYATRIDIKPKRLMELGGRFFVSRTAASEDSGIAEGGVAEGKKDIEYIELLEIQKDGNHRWKFEQRLQEHKILAVSTAREASLWVSVHKGEEAVLRRVQVSGRQIILSNEDTWAPAYEIDKYTPSKEIRVSKDGYWVATLENLLQFKIGDSTPELVLPAKGALGIGLFEFDDRNQTLWFTHAQALYRVRPETRISCSITANSGFPLGRGLLLSWGNVVHFERCGYNRASAADSTVLAGRPMLLRLSNSSHEVEQVIQTLSPSARDMPVDYRLSLEDSAWQEVYVVALDNEGNAALQSVTVVSPLNIWIASSIALLLTALRVRPVRRYLTHTPPFKLIASVYSKLESWSIALFHEQRLREKVRRTRRSSKSRGLLIESVGQSADLARSIKSLQDGSILSIGPGAVYSKASVEEVFFSAIYGEEPPSGSLFDRLSWPPVLVALDLGHDLGLKTSELEALERRLKETGSEDGPRHRYSNSFFIAFFSSRPAASRKAIEESARLLQNAFDGLHHSKAILFEWPDASQISQLLEDVADLLPQNTMMKFRKSGNTAYAITRVRAV